MYEVEVCSDFKKMQNIKTLFFSMFFRVQTLVTYSILAYESRIVLVLCCINSKVQFYFYISIILFTIYEGM